MCLLLRHNENTHAFQTTNSVMLELSRTVRFNHDALQVQLLRKRKVMDVFVFPSNTECLMNCRTVVRTKGRPTHYIQTKSEYICELHVINSFIPMAQNLFKVRRPTLKHLSVILQSLDDCRKLSTCLQCVVYIYHVRKE